jgi:hypothetical protein
MAYYCDASIPGPVAQALALVRDDVLYQVGKGVRSRVQPPRMSCGCLLLAPTIGWY